MISGPSEYVLIDHLVSISDAILNMVNIAANMLGAKTEETSEAEGIFIYFFVYIKSIPGSLV